MQRSSGDGTQAGSGPLANYDTPSAPPPLAPGQVFAPSAVARVWPTLPELANALKRRMVLAVFLGLLVGTAAAAAVWLALPNGKHQVRAMLDIAPSNGSLATNMNEGQFDSFKQKQQELIKTRLLLEKVKSNPAVAKLPEIVNSDDPVRFLEENIRVTWPAPELMRITMSGDDPKQLQIILDTLITEFIKDAEGAESRDRAKTRVRLEANLGTIDKEIEMHQNRIKRIVEQKSAAHPELNAVLLKAATDRLTDNMRLRQNLEALQPAKKVATADLAARLKEVDAAPIAPTLIDRAIAADPQFASLAADLQRAENKLELTLGTGSPDRPVVKKDQAEVDRARAKFREQTEAQRPKFEKLARDQARASLAATLASKASEIKDDQVQIETYNTIEKLVQEDINRLTRNDFNAAIAQNDLKPLNDRRDRIQQALLDLDMQSRNDARITIRETANIILNQNLKQKVLLAIASFLAGTTALMLAVAFLEWRSRRVDSVDQVVSELGLRVIGTIPAFPSKQALKSGDAATSQNWRFVLNESVNSARTMLLHTAKTQNMQVLMVTSAMQGEGKTSLASQLATSMATAGLRTLILDCDLRNPSMHKLFDAPLTPGCSEVLCQEVDVSDAVQPTAVPNLWLIPAGQCSNRVVSALAQGHPLETLFNRLRGQFDFVVVDSCPVLPVADTLLVGQHVDGVVISILQDISQLPKVQQVSDRLTDLNIPLLGAVVNGVKPDIHAYGYNYVKQLPA